MRPGPEAVCGSTGIWLRNVALPNWNDQSPTPTADSPGRIST